MFPDKQRRRTATLAVSVAGLVVAGLVLPATAGARPAPAAGAAAGTVEVLVDGLNNPRKVTWDPRLHLALVAEGGLTTAPCIGPTAGGCFSKSGAILAYQPDLDYSARIVTKLPALNGPGGLSGLNEVTTHGFEMRALFGLTGTLATRAPYGAEALPLGQVNRITLTGKAVPLADLVAYEEANNPDGGGLNSNPFGMSTDSAGTVAADAGANAVYKVGPQGQLSVLFAPPKLDFNGRLIDSVPTSVVRGADGAYYIGELTGGPFPAGRARVWRVVPGQPATVFATGFTNIIDLAVDARGRLLVLEYAKNGLASGDATGRLVRIGTDGAQTVLAEQGLVHPGGVAAAPNGDIFVTNQITQGDGTGQLLRVRASG